MYQPTIQHVGCELLQVVGDSVLMLGNGSCEPVSAVCVGGHGGSIGFISTVSPSLDIKDIKMGCASGVNFGTASINL